MLHNCSVRVTVVLGVNCCLVTLRLHGAQFKKGVWHSVKMRLKTQEQNDCYQATYISMLPRPAFHSYLALEVSYLYSSTSSLILMLWHLDTQGKC